MASRKVKNKPVKRGPKQTKEKGPAKKTAKPSGHLAAFKLPAKANVEKQLGIQPVKVKSQPTKQAPLKPLVPKVADYQSFRLVGLGGVGCLVLRNLTTFLNGLQIPVHLCLIDGDEYEPSNVSRMDFEKYGNKAAIKAEEIKSGKLTHGAVTTFEDYLTTENIQDVIREDDIIFCCVDNHQTRKLLNDHCATLKNVVLISGGNDGVDLENGKLGVYGNVQIYVRRNGEDVTAPLTAFHKEIREPKDKHPNDVSCLEAAQSTPQIFFANAMVANNMCNAFYLLSCGQLKYQEVCFDILDARQLPQITLPEPVSL